ncbi:starvation-inducible protein, partial [bacterium]|nr:starvation-inducible protein [bacterium]
MVKSGTRFIFLFCLAAALAACAPISQDIRRQADASAPFSEIQKNPDKYRGEMVIWGGVIIETTNLKESTAI